MGNVLVHYYSRTPTTLSVSLTLNNYTSNPVLFMSSGAAVRSVKPIGFQSKNQRLLIPKTDLNNNPSIHFNQCQYVTLLNEPDRGATYAINPAQPENNITPHTASGQKPCFQTSAGLPEEGISASGWPPGQNRYPARQGWTIV